MPRIGSAALPLCFLVLLALGFQSARVESLKNIDAVAASTKKRREQSKGVNGSRANFDYKDVGTTRPSLREINRGGGGGGGGKGTFAPSSAPASRKLLRSMRLLYLTYYASLGALMPYLPVYFHSLGHPGSSIGLLGAVKPLTTFLVAPLWGVLSDRSNNHVSTLQFTFVSSLIFQLLVGYPNSSLNYLIAAVFVAAVLNAPVKSLIDSIVMSKLTSDEDRHQFGRMRLWGQIGFGVGSSLVGSLLSAFPANLAERSAPSTSSAAATSDPTLGKVVHNIEVGMELASDSDAAAGTTAVVSSKARTAFLDMTRDLLGKTRPLKGYEWAFATHAILSIPVYFCIRAFRPDRDELVAVGNKKKEKEDDASMEENEKKSDTTEGLRLLGKNTDALIFFFLVFVIGTSSGCVENFAYVRVREVGGTGNDMGALRLISSLAGAPMFWFSGPVTEALGTDAILALSLLAYAARFFNYAWMRRPFHALPAEALRGITFAAFWSSASLYAHRISPPGMKATMLLIMNAMYGGLGQSLGAIIGGKMQSKVGTVNTFIYSGIFDACFVAALVAYLLSGTERAFSVASIPVHP